MVTLDVRDMMENAEKIRASAETSRRQYMELESNVRDKRALTMMDTACVGALRHELANL